MPDEWESWLLGPVGHAGPKLLPGSPATPWPCSTRPNCSPAQWRGRMVVWPMKDPLPGKGRRGEAAMTRGGCGEARTMRRRDEMVMRFGQRLRRMMKAAERKDRGGVVEEIEEEFG
ncbi:hypothetical protein Droror1_Dr00004203 [Drosera rotundifolia]